MFQEEAETVLYVSHGVQFLHNIVEHCYTLGSLLWAAGDNWLARGSSAFAIIKRQSPWEGLDAAANFVMSSAWSAVILQHLLYRVSQGGVCLVQIPGHY